MPAQAAGGERGGRARRWPAGGRGESKMERADEKALLHLLPSLHGAPRTGSAVKIATHLRFPSGLRGAAPSTPGERTGRLGSGLQGPGGPPGLAGLRVLYKSRAAGGERFPLAEHPPLVATATPESPRHCCARRPLPCPLTSPAEMPLPPAPCRQRQPPPRPHAGPLPAPRPPPGPAAAAEDAAAPPRRLHPPRRGHAGSGELSAADGGDSSGLSGAAAHRALTTGQTPPLAALNS